MANELEVTYDTGMDVEARIKTQAGTAVQTVALVEAGGGGVYRADFPAAIAAGTYDVDYYDVTGELNDLIGNETITWTGSAAAVDGDADNGAYLSVNAARALAATLPAADFSALMDLEDGELAAALLMATFDLDAAGPWQGIKYDPTQKLEFPRVDGDVARYIPPGQQWPGVRGGPLLEETVWDWDPTANDGAGAAVVPAKVKVACLCQAAWDLNPANAARLQAIKSGLAAQSIGGASETYLKPAELAQIAGGGGGGGFSGLCDTAQRFMSKYRVKSGSLL